MKMLCFVNTLGKYSEAGIVRDESLKVALTELSGQKCLLTLLNEALSFWG